MLEWRNAQVHCELRISAVQVTSPVIISTQKHRQFSKSKPSNYHAIIFISICTNLNVTYAVFLKVVCELCCRLFWDELTDCPHQNLCVALALLQMLLDRPLAGTGEEVPQGPLGWMSSCSISWERRQRHGCRKRGFGVLRSPLESITTQGASTWLLSRPG